MSHSPFTNITVFLKKFARKGSLRRKFSTSTHKKLRPHTTSSPLCTTTNIIVATQEADMVSVSSGSISLDRDEKHLSVPVIVGNEKSTLEFDQANLRSSASSPIPPPPALSDVDEDAAHGDNDTIEPMNELTKQTSTPSNDLDSSDHQRTPTPSHLSASTPSLGTSMTSPHDPTVHIRDFAYDETLPLHRGEHDSDLKRMLNHSNVSLSSTRFNGCRGRALFDFVPESDHEIPMNAGQSIWIQYRQCEGWLIADVDGQTGLVPEAYVERL